jgi:nucleoside-diphosphate-sugar epimerase
MTTKLTVLVAGSTDMLGSKIVAALLDKGNIDVRAMVKTSALSLYNPFGLYKERKCLYLSRK